MSFNTGGLATNIPLTNLVYMRMAQEGEFIVDKVFPKLEVIEDQGTIYNIVGEHFKTDDYTLGASGRAHTVYSKVDQNNTYDVKYYAVKEFLANKELKKVPEKNRAVFKEAVAYGVANRLRIQKEKKASSTLFSTSTFSSYTEALGADNRFDNPASNIFRILRAGITNVRRSSGQSRNLKIVVGEEVWDAICNHPQVLARMADNSLRAPTAEIFKNMINDGINSVGQVIVGQATYNSAADKVDGTNTETWTDLWGKYLLIMASDDKPTQKSQSCTLQLVSQGADLKLQTFKESPEDDGDFYRAEMGYDLKVPKPNAGYLFSAVVN